MAKKSNEKNGANATEKNEGKTASKKEEKTATAKQLDFNVIAVLVVLAILAAFIAQNAFQLYSAPEQPQKATPVPSPTATPIPTPCPEGVIKERECVGIYSGVLTYYQCEEGKWASKRDRDVPECNINIDVDKINATPTPAAAKSYEGKNSSVLMAELRTSVEKIIQNVLNQNFSCVDNSLNYRREFTCSGPRQDGYVTYTFKALNLGTAQTLPANKATATLDGRQIIYEKQLVGTTDTANVYLLCHATQTLLQYIVPAKDDEGKLLTNTLAQECPE